MSGQNVATLDAATQDRLAAVLETRRAEPQQLAVRRAFLANIPFPTPTHVSEVVCGASVATRRLASWPDVATIVGVDPAPVLLGTAGRDEGSELQQATRRYDNGCASARKPGFHAPV
jgi:trans-aconitate methyltransferase